jgi:putative transposase
MQTGSRFRIYPTPQQEKILLQWIGCRRFLYNAKVSEDRYFRAFSRKFGGEVPIDQEYSRFISTDTPWLREVPGQVLRNGAVYWRQAC